MNKSKLLSATKFSIYDNLRSMISEVAIVSVIFIGIAVFFSLNIFGWDFTVTNSKIHFQMITEPNSKTTFVGCLEFTYCIITFVTGIIMIISNLKMFIQNGIGRKTLLKSHLIYGALLSLFFTVIAHITYLIIFFINPELATPFCSKLCKSNSNFEVWLVNIVITFLIVFISYNLGSLIASYFYRLSKKWIIINAIFIPTIVINLLSWIIIELYNGPCKKLFNTMFSGFGFTSITLLCFGVLLYFLTYLLVRKAPIKKPR